MLETGWSWDQYQSTPPYVQRVVWDVVQARRKRDADQQAEAERKAEAARGGR